jgi:feruloyl esterase
MLKLEFGAEFQRSRQGTGVLDAQPDLRAFKAHGGKLIHFHGWNDPAIPAKASIVYYEDVSHSLGKTDDFYRMYLVPGMLHCGGGPGPNNVDWLALLDNWVRTGARPGEVTATGPGQSRQVLCPYPSASRKQADGGYVCAAPKKG